MSAAILIETFNPPARDGLFIGCVERDFRVKARRVPTADLSRAQAAGDNPDAFSDVLHGAASHEALGVSGDWNWRYRRLNNTVYWWEPPEDPRDYEMARDAVENWLGRNFGVSKPVHKKLVANNWKSPDWRLAHGLSPLAESLLDAILEEQPSQAQIEAGNYKKTHKKVAGLDVTVENAVGSTRSGKDENGKAWSVKMKADYGYLKGRIGGKKVARGKDNDELDIFVKDGTPEDYEGPVFVVNQTKAADGKGGLDEHKCVLGVKDVEAARKLYLSHYEDGWSRYDGIAEFESVEAFKEWATSAPQLKSKASGDELHEALTGKALMRAMDRQLDIWDNLVYHPSTGFASNVDVIAAAQEKLGRARFEHLARAMLRATGGEPHGDAVAGIAQLVVGGSKLIDPYLPAVQEAIISLVLEESSAQAELDDIIARHTASGKLQVRISHGKKSHDYPEVVVLDHIRASKDAPPGTGSAFMQDFVRWADRNGALIALQTAVGFDKGVNDSGMKRTTSTDRLKGFYRRFGFKYSKGKYCYRPDLPGNMHRHPRRVSEGARLFASLALLESALSDRVIAHVREWFGRQPQVPYELDDALTHDNVAAANAVLASRGLPPVTDPQWERTWDVRQVGPPILRRANRVQKLRQPMLAESTSEMPQGLSDLYDGAGAWEGVDFTAEALQKVCQDERLTCVWNKDQTVAVVGGQWVIEVHPKYPEIDTLDSWIWQATESDAEDFGVGAGDFNRHFWEHPQALYHATPDENVDGIRQHGLGVRSETRGLSNRSVGAAVFTSTEYEELYGHGSYGSNIFEIDTGAMKADGYTPEVSQEPEVAEAEWRGSLAHKLGADDRLADSVRHTSSDMSPTTVIVHGNIPPKYLHLAE